MFDFMLDFFYVECFNVFLGAKDFVPLNKIGYIPK